MSQVTALHDSPQVTQLDASSSPKAGSRGKEDILVPKAALWPCKRDSQIMVAHLVAQLGGQDKLLLAFDCSLRLLPRHAQVAANE